MSLFPPLDLHAHVAPDIAEGDLYDLGAVVFAVTRSLDEASSALSRDDELAVWGVGCHPALASAHPGFDATRFDELLESTALAGELGLDGRSRVPMPTQLDTLRAALEVLATKPRIVSLHSYAATEALIHQLERTKTRGLVLHWWLGKKDLTHRAVKLGCYFSIPPAAARRSDLLVEIPLDRVLTETDHPDGNRGTAGARPGNVEAVERALAAHHDMEQEEIRQTIWHNLARLTKEVACGRLLPARLRTLLAALPSEPRQP